MATGTVYLVGAGPGDPGLLTLKGRRCLEEADVVLYDGLVNPLLLRHTRGTAERTSREGPAGQRRLAQEEINAKLIEAARQGKSVVRLKGGDPFIFGRGFEEAAALREAGVRYEIVPGITAATAAGVYAGVTFTHRRHSSAVALVTGHEDPSKSERTLDYQRLAEFPGTLVFYMGLHRLPEIAQALIAQGKPPETPSAVISQATTPDQRIVSAPLAELPDAAAGLTAPSLIVVGECVALREQADWYESLPLFGQHIGVTRPIDQAETVVQRCLALGAEPVLMPTIAIGPPDDWAPVDAAIARIEDFDWLVFTSANGVRGLMQRLWELGGDARRINGRIAAIGSATAETLQEWNLWADLVPDEFRAEALAEALVAKAVGRRVLWARANRGRDVLPKRLVEAGAALEEVVVYNNTDVALSESVIGDIRSGRMNWIGLSSPSIARSLQASLPKDCREGLGRSTRLAAISPVTAAAAEEVGLPVAAVAETYTWDGLLQAIVREQSGRKG